MQPSNDSAEIGDDVASLASSENSVKISKYRAMVARTDSTIWRGNARSKLAAGIEEGITDPINLNSNGDDKNREIPDEVTLASQFAENEKPTTTDTIDLSAEDTPEEIQGEGKIINKQADGVKDPWSELSEAEIVGSGDKDTLESTDGLNKKSSIENAADEEEEPGIPIIYKNWEPVPGEEETEMDDIELGGGSETEKHYGECKIDDEAFERHRAQEQEWKQRQRRHRCYLATYCLVFITMLLLIVWAALGLKSTMEQDMNKVIIIQVNATKNRWPIGGNQQSLAHDALTSKVSQSTKSRSARGYDFQ
jgi:hypothetical protein